MALILVNCDFDEKPDPRSFLYRSYTDSILRAGGVPILMPILRKREEIRKLLSLAQGVLLSGGDDPNPKRYGEELHPKTLLMNPEKEEADFMLAEEALKSGLPVFGICWGMQLINIVLGGNLIQDIPSEKSRDTVHKLPDRQPAYHKIMVESFSRVGEMIRRCGWEGHGQKKKSAEPLSVEVNSFHHQAVNRLGGGLRSVAVAPDGIVEAVEGDTARFLVGVQWHPERMPNDPLAQELFKTFVGVCSRGK